LLHSQKLENTMKEDRTAHARAELLRKMEQMQPTFRPHVSQSVVTETTPQAESAIPLPGNGTTQTAQAE
jgi:hypothetical protein